VSLQSGALLGPYEIVALIGAGGMGQVYRARDQRIGRDVAVKVLPPELATNRERLRRFEQEARTAGALDHPNIVAVHDVGTYEGSPFIVSELLEGETLGDRLSAGALPVRKAVEYAVQIAQGLAAAHEKGIIHRDLKPWNVFVKKDGYVKILDFGIAKLVTPTGPTESGHATTMVDATGVGVTLGTVGYMSPEQVRGRNLDPRSDIFSFGCVLYEMLSGKPPFKRETAPDTTSAILRDEPQALTGTGRGIPPGLERIVNRCLEKEPGRRFSSAHDLALALQGEGEGLIASASAARSRGQRPWIWGGAIALGVAVSTVAAIYFLAGHRHQGLSSPATAIRSIAVLPLANLSGDPAQEYFADGMTDELITTLSQISSLKVIARTSVMQFKGSKTPLREIAAALGVEGIIEGTVLHVGDRVRITTQLIDPTTDTNIWAQSYDREVKDVLALQNEVALAIAGEVRAKLTPQEQTRLAGGRPVNPESYRLCLEGRHLLWTTSSDEDLNKAVEQFQKAITLDPTYAPAYAGLALCYNTSGYRGNQPAYESFPSARAAARRALELDEGLAEAHAVLGQVMFQADWDWAGAERELRRAIDLDPGSSDAHAAYAFYLLSVGRTASAVQEYKRAQELDPLTPGRTFNVGIALYYARRYDDSLVQLKKALEMDPADAWTRMMFGWNYVHKRMYSEAMDACDKAVEASPEDPNVLGVCGNVSGLAGKRPQALALLERLKNLSTRRYVDPYNMALVCDGVADNDCTMDWLERSVTERSAGLASIRSELWSDKLRADPRFQDLVRQMNYPTNESQ
jgi:serine/threonine protein kinase/tetratricopeptide (TPR) repeat protein